MASLRTALAIIAMLSSLAACMAVEDSADAARLMWRLADPPPLDVAARQEVTWTTGDVRRVADLYEPRQHRAAIVLAPGLGREGRRDVRLTAFAVALTGAGFRVLVPDVPNFQAQRVAADDSVVLADALRYLLERQGDQGTVAIAAISYAVGPAVFAALEPDIAPRVSAIAAVGGYYDTRSVVTFFTTGYYRDRAGGPWLHRAPNAYGKWVFVLANAERIADPQDRTALAAMARRKLANLHADIDDLGARLGPEGRAVVDLLANSDPDRVPALVAALPEAVRADLDGLSLAGRDLGVLRAKLILIHGRDDAIIPYAESVALAAAVPSGQAHLALLDSLMHADLGPASVADAYRLWRAAYELMRARRDMAIATGDQTR
jgi:pimeloyl-ACP methyl ester carboxylesterase